MSYDDGDPALDFTPFRQDLGGSLPGVGVVCAVRYPGQQMLGRINAEGAFEWISDLDEVARTFGQARVVAPHIQGYAMWFGDWRPLNPQPTEA